MKQKRWVPDMYVNAIRFRVPRPESIRVGAPIEANFGTWKEAHEWLIERRKREETRAKGDLELARKRLARALRMTAPLEARQ